VSWQPREHPATQPHEYIRGGTTKILTLFHPATGQVRLQPAARGTNAVLHPWLRERLSAILAELPSPGSSQDAAATQTAWAVWQAGLTMPFTLPHNLPPLRLLLVWDNLTGHKTPDLVVWLCAHGVMPLYTPVGGSWLNMAESIERVLKRRALDGQHPHSPEEIGSWFEQTARAWNKQPTPFVWNGKRRQRRRSGGQPIHRLGGSGACTHKPLRRSRPVGPNKCQTSQQMTHQFLGTEDLTGSGWRRTGRSSGARSTSMLRATPGWRRMRTRRSSVSTIWCTEGGLTPKWRCMSLSAGGRPLTRV